VGGFTALSFLSDVSCASRSDCWAVGAHPQGGLYHTLIARWNGHTWAVVGSPDAGATEDNSLAGVVCRRGSRCWAVGQVGNRFQLNGPAPQTLIEMKR
jgi:hypothetical protein